MSASIRPNASTAACAIAAACPASVTSSRTVSIRPPAPRTAATVAAQSAMSAATMRAPWAASPVAYSCPMPPAAPVTITTLSATLIGSDLHHDVFVLDRDREGFRHIRAFHDARPRRDFHRIAAHRHLLRVAPGLAGAHVELPAVPRAAQDLALARKAVGSGLARFHQAAEHALGERSALMRAAVEHAEELAADVEDGDRAALDGDQFARHGRDFPRRGHDVLAHRRVQLPSARTRDATTRPRSRQPARSARNLLRRPVR